MSKSQTTLEKFFINNPTKKSEKNDYQIKKYFYLIWINKFKPEIQAYWSDKKPDKVNYIEHINCDYIKKGFYYYICGYFPDIDEEEYKLPKEKVYKNIHYLKSHLQKCVRKQDDILAIPTCYHLLKLDINELIRRLPIIMLEDTFLHESFTTLIWLMVALSTKKFKIKRYIYEWILGIVYILCITKNKDNICNELNDNMISDLNIMELLNSYKYLDQTELSLLYSMHIRISYGGLKGDLEMINLFLNIWKNRFIYKLEEVNNIQIKPITIYVKELSIEEWDLSAIDYHCNSKFLEYISKKYDDIEINELKKIIWNHSSSINSREKKNKKYDITEINKWNEIKDYVKKTQKYLLNSSY
jgi:hypothetical protein